MSAEIVFENKEIKDFILSLSRRLKTIKDGGKKYIGLLSAIVYKDVMNHFDEEKGSAGPWPEWSLSYAMTVNGRGAFRRFKGRTVFLDPYQMELYNIKPPRKPGKKLQDKGRLRNSFTPTKVKVTPNAITWFNKAVTKGGYPYAWAHNEGDGNIPKRDFMWASDTAQESIAEKTLQFMIDEGV